VRAVKSPVQVQDCTENEEGGQGLKAHHLTVPDSTPSAPSMRSVRARGSRCRRCNGWRNVARHAMLIAGDHQPSNPRYPWKSCVEDVQCVCVAAARALRCGFWQQVGFGVRWWVTAVRALVTRCYANGNGEAGCLSRACKHPCVSKFILCAKCVEKERVWMPLGLSHLPNQGDSATQSVGRKGSAVSRWVRVHCLMGVDWRGMDDGCGICLGLAQRVACVHVGLFSCVFSLIGGGQQTAER
jgi:hypothetical protein